MAYPEILRDKRKAAIPQLWDGSNWRPLKGTKDGHQQTQLVGPDGQPIGSENPLEVRVRELEEKLDAMNQLLQSGDAKMQLSGRTEPIYEQSLPVSPLGGNSTYTSPTIDCKEFEFPNGSKGVVSISALAQADAQGTLYLEGRNADSETWVRLESTAVNNTGRGILQRTNIAYRFVRLRFQNGEDDQTEFSLSYTLWQVTDGQGNRHGQGADQFTSNDPLAPSTRVTVMDVRSAVQLYQIHFQSDYGGINVEVHAYKDDGSLIPIGRNLTSTSSSGSWSPNRYASRVQSLLSPYHTYNSEESLYAFVLDPSLYGSVWPKGLRVQLHNPDTENTHNARMAITCNLL